jgi:hypothetical protein
VVTNLGAGVLLTSPQNIAFTRAIGFEFPANGRLSRTVGYRFSGNAYRQHLKGDAANGDQQQSATVLSGKASIDWQLNPTTLIQLNSTLLGKLPQGFVDPVGSGFGVRHKFRNSLWGTLTVQDAFARHCQSKCTAAASSLCQQNQIGINGANLPFSAPGNLAQMLKTMPSALGLTTPTNLV